MKDNESEYIPEEAPKKNLQLKVFLLLSLIGGGMSVFSNTIFYFFKDFLLKAMDEQPALFENFFSKETQVMFSFSPYYFLSNLGIAILSFSGALLMWNLKKNGFHLYVISQFLFLIAISYFVPNVGFPISPLLMSAIFIYVYANNLKTMN